MSLPKKIVVKDTLPAKLNITLPSGKTLEMVHKPHDVVLNKNAPGHPVPFTPKTRAERYV